MPDAQQATRPPSSLSPTAEHETAADAQDRIAPDRLTGASPDDLGQEGTQSNIKQNTTDCGRRLDRE